MVKHSPSAEDESLHTVAKRFTQARRTGQRITEYPGPQPQTLDEAYAIQNDAMALWPEDVGGWKVGRIVGADAKRLGTDRLAGPIFEPAIVHAGTEMSPMPVYGNAFAAVEGEIILVVGEDAPAQKTKWSLDEARQMVGGARHGVEIASSPFSGINDFGPLVTISDFGNNKGLIVGGEISDWQDFEIGDWTCETLIDEVSVGHGHAGNIPGGPLESLRFLLENTASRGLPLRKGMYISTGALTGVHEASVGQSACVVFGETAIECILRDHQP